MTILKQQIGREPVRAYLYGVLGPALTLLVGYGYANANQALLWAALAGALLGVPAGELARARVVPVATLQELDPLIAQGAGRHAAPPRPAPAGETLEWERL